VTPAARTQQRRAGGKYRKYRKYREYRKYRKYRKYRYIFLKVHGFVFFCYND